MTREEYREAIEYIKKYRELDEELYQTAPPTTVAHNALTKCLRYWDMAIEALEQESKMTRKVSEPMTDAEAYRILQTSYEDAKSKHNWILAHNIAMLALKDKLNGLEQEQKTGHWIEDKVDDFYASFGYKQFHCDNCGEVFKGTSVKPTNFCSNCGARMSEVSKE